MQQAPSAARLGMPGLEANGLLALAAWRCARRAWSASGARRTAAAPERERSVECAAAPGFLRPGRGLGPLVRVVADPTTVASAAPSVEASLTNLTALVGPSGQMVPEAEAAALQAAAVIKEVRAVTSR